MKILLTDITVKSHSFSVDESVPFQEEGKELSTEVHAEFVFNQQKKDIYRLCGNLKAKIISSCDRCGKTVQLDVDENFLYRFLLQEEPQFGSEYQCTGDDCELLYLANPEVDCSEVLSEQLLLALPTHRICVDGCKGLCEQCGVDLNRKQCTCREINKNSPFAILKDL